MQYVDKDDRGPTVSWGFNRVSVLFAWAVTCGRSIFTLYCTLCTV